MVQRYIKELDTEHTGSYTTATELVNLNAMHSVKQYDRVHCQARALINTIAWNFSYVVSFPNLQLTTKHFNLKLWPLPSPNPEKMTLN